MAPYNTIVFIFHLSYSDLVLADLVRVGLEGGVKPGCYLTQLLLYLFITNSILTPVIEKN